MKFMPIFDGFNVFNKMNVICVKKYAQIISFLNFTKFVIVLFD